MLFIEVYARPGAFGQEELRRLADRLTPGRLFAAAEGDGETADPGVLALLDSLGHVVVHEPAIWATSGPARCVVNVYATAWAKEMSEHLVSSVTAAVPGGEAIVHVFSVPQGGYGVEGRVRRASDVLTMIGDAKHGVPGEPPPGAFVDPVCGATVLRENAVTLERDGTTYGFCCPHCRRHFAQQA
ncbi:YHS domain-containing protein [Nonomuraea sp. NPDC048826]|uniref:YHS domain-containing protein n=1 Tax=Nonomuraea sp. NPDC048826 TaxID=3364347 RepID=UPI0037150AD0